MYDFSEKNLRDVAACRPNWRAL